MEGSKTGSLIFGNAEAATEEDWAGFSAEILVAFWLGSKEAPTVLSAYLQAVCWAESMSSEAKWLDATRENAKTQPKKAKKPRVNKQQNVTIK